MSLTRTHIAFLGIMSIFTGIIGPGTRSGEILLSYLMTDVRGVIYFILIGLILAFSFAAFRKWRMYRFTVFLIICGLIGVAIVTSLGFISNSRDGMPAGGFSWGWIFLLVGGFLLAWSYIERRDDGNDGKFSETIDTIIGIMGGFALACIAGVIILSSFSYFTRGKGDSEILNRFFSTGSVKTISGEIKIVGSFQNMPAIKYNRGEGYLLLSYSNENERIWEYRNKENILSGVLQNDESVIKIDNEIYTIDEVGHVRTSSGRVILGSRSTEDKNIIVYKEDGRIMVKNKDGKRELILSGIIQSPLYSSSNGTLFWIETKDTLKYILANGEKIGSGYADISTPSFSSNGQNITFLAKSGSETSMIRNNINIGVLPKNTQTGTYNSNGSHSIYATYEAGVFEVHLDTNKVSRDLQDVREIFIEENGGDSYAYFGKPVGEEKWCLFTRYKGNLCGLEGYMNPRIGADGSSIIFAGKKDSVWNIYRNTDALARDTGYHPTSVSYDYAFYDLTNPRTYIIISYDKNTKKYSYRKNGKQIPGFWDDVSLEVFFGYDNHVMTTAKSENSWKIIEF
ncbi:MAG: hypothetical protein HHAS10_06620 [Candidatus Altimarinota bacterium]